MIIYDMGTTDINLTAKIAWPITSWEEVNFKQRLPGDQLPASLGDEFICLAGKESQPQPDLSDNPAQNKSGFWKELNQLHFAFIDDDKEKIRRFYKQYGPLRTGDNSHSCESWDGARAALGWFNLLTSLVSWLKDDEYQRIKDLVKTSAAPIGSDYVKKLAEHGIPPSIDLYKKLSYSLEISQPVFNRDIEDAWNNLGKYKKNDLIEATWDMIVRASWDRLNKSGFRPEKTRTAQPVFNLTAHGAFQAGFLQWYFEELAYLNVKRCKWPDCNALMLSSHGNKGDYCATHTRTREQQRGRARKKLVEKGFDRKELQNLKLEQLNDMLEELESRELSDDEIRKKKLDQKPPKTEDWQTLPLVRDLAYSLEAFQNIAIEGWRKPVTGIEVDKAQATEFFTEDTENSEDEPARFHIETEQPLNLSGDDLAEYYREIVRYPLLSREEEVVLAKRIERGDRDAEREMIQANLRLVVKIAKDLSNSYEIYLTNDLIQEGNLGLIRAVKEFDYRKGYRFSTCAKQWVEKMVKEASIIKEPSDRRVILPPQNPPKSSTAPIRDWWAAAKLSAYEKEIRKLLKRMDSDLTNHEKTILGNKHG